MPRGNTRRREKRSAIFQIAYHHAAGQHHEGVKNVARFSKSRIELQIRFTQEEEDDRSAGERDG